MGERSRRTGLTLIEVMIVMVILMIASLGLMAHTWTLAQARALAIQQSQAQHIAGVVIERLQGAAWNELTSSASEWAQPRWAPRTAVPPSPPSPLPPLVDGDATIAGTLQHAGIIVAKSGMPDLKLYLEYYDQKAMDLGAGVARTAAQAAWRAAVADTNATTWLRLVNGAVDVKPGEEFLVVRILLTWKEVGGTPTYSHEVFAARKK